MKTQYPENWPQFYTATIQDWKHLLKDDRYKEVIIDCLRFLVQSQKVTISAFVIMSNHIHLIWQANANNDLEKIQTSFKKYTSRHFTRLLKLDNQIGLYEVNSVDRKYQFWKRNSLGIELFTTPVFNQKMEYIHDNPVQAGLCS